MSRRRQVAFYLVSAMVLTFSSAARENAPIVLWIVEAAAFLVLAAGFTFLLAQPPRLRPVPAPEPPPALPREPRDRRRGLDPADPANAALLESCPVCGMRDPERFRLGVGVDRWHGWPAHDSCVTWLGEQKQPAVAAAVGLWQVMSEPPSPVRLCVQERLEPVRVIHEPGSAPVFSVRPAGGMSIAVTGWPPGGDSFEERRLTLVPAPSAHPRCDLICWERKDFPGGASWQAAIGVPGTPGVRPCPPALPSGAQLIAYVTIPAGCTHIHEGLIRCALPPELPSIR